MTSSVQFCISNPLLGQLRSNDIIRSIYLRFSITFYWNEIAIWGRCQCVHLVKTYLILSDLIYLGQSVTLTFGDLRSKLPSELSGSQSNESIRIDERKTMVYELTYLGQSLT